jgi:tRNA(Ile)-lysidine synthase
MLQQINPQVSKGLFRLTNMLSAENAVLKQQTDALIQQTVHWRPGGRAVICRDLYQAAPLAIQRRLLRHVVDFLLPPSSIANFDHIESLRQFIVGIHSGKRLKLPGGCVAEWQIDTVLLWNLKRFSPVAFTMVISVPGVTSISALGTYLIAEVCETASCGLQRMSGRAWLAMERLRFPLEIRFARPGDRFYPVGAQGPKKLKDFFIDSKVPRVERAFVPLVVSGTDIVWVVGYRIAEPFKVRPDTQYILSLQYTSNEPDTSCIPQNG